MPYYYSIVLVISKVVVQLIIIVIIYIKKANYLNKQKIFDFREPKLNSLREPLNRNL